ncbi:hypothetical protein TEA_009233 [Camellia sinensis var. sinensis]|uniref:DUF7610 domain-containing protein n=1 Tax=Camellia sinensis var. sinensis TaxID=542762 RepID=A0A4S4ED49_CAMSN|nr:hypothetical protein TEA_009233 [Camellia sinensis var. sinensis]
MAKGYAILQRKLEQLESDLLQVLSLPPETPCHQLLSEGIKQRFVFFTNLLSTELSSASSSPSHSSKTNYQLRHIANRLSQFESAFRDWDHHQISSLAAPASAETCSCTESCVNDDGDMGSTELGDQAFYEDDYDDDDNDDYVEVFEEPVVEEKATMTMAMAMATESVGVERDVKKEEEKEGRVWGWSRYCGVMGGGVVVGALLMGFVMVRFCDCFNCYLQHGDSLSLIPT